MSARRFGGAGMIAGVAAGVALLLALGLIGFALMQMTSTDEAVPFRNACQGEDPCRQTLVERLPKLQAAPGGVAAALHEALTRSSPALPPDATLAACQATGAPESCGLDPGKLKPGEAAALVATLDAYGLMLGRQDKACRYVEGCAARALAALGVYGFDPLHVQRALQRTSLPLPPELKACATASPETVRDVCDADRLLKAPREPLVVALEQDWASGGDRVRLPRPADPQAQTARNALWAGLGAVLGMLLVGLVWAVAALTRGPRKTRLTQGGQGEAVASGAADMVVQARRAFAEPPSSFPTRPPGGDVGAEEPARPPAGAARGPRLPDAAPPAAAADSKPRPAQGRPAAPFRQPSRQGSRPVVEPHASSPLPPALMVFQAALAIPGPAATFARLAAEEATRLSPRFDEAERLAAGAILAAHRLRGDRPAEAHAGAYDDLVFGLAGADHRLVWPRAGAPITAEMDTCDEGDLYSHAVEAVVRPGLADGSGALVLRPRVRAR